jgi:hypothetical protein
MIAIECSEGANAALGGTRLPSDWWMDVLLASTKGRGVKGFAPTAEAEARFNKALASMGITAGVLRHETDLAQVSCLIARSPDSMARHAWTRQTLTREAGGATAWSIMTVVDESTVIQSVASLARLVTLPVYAWDAIVCSSYQVRRQVLWIFKAQMAQIQQRFGVSRLVLPQVEVIRPGLYGSRVTQPEPFLREIEMARRAGDIVLLVRDRDEEVFSLRQALEILAADGVDLDALLVVQTGSDAIDLAVPEVRSLRLESSCERAFSALCRVADIVCLLPTVASAADTQDLLAAARGGAAILASDLGVAADLCRFTEAARTRPDALGIKVKTWCAPAGEDSALALMSGIARGEEPQRDLAAMLIDAGRGSGRTWPHSVLREVCGLSTIDAVDLAAAARALVHSSDLRETLGRRAAEAVGSNNWRAGCGRLMEVLGQLRAVADRSNADPMAELPDPAHADPLHLQEACVTSVLSPDTRLGLADGVDPASSVGAIVRRAALLFKASRLESSRVLPSHEELAAVVEAFRSLPSQAWPGLRARDAIDGVVVERQVHVFRSLIWCVRIGLLRILSAPVTEVPDTEVDDKFGLYAERSRG